MRPLDTRVGALEHFELRFELPVGPGERGVANVAPCENEAVWGAHAARGVMARRPSRRYLGLLLAGARRSTSTASAACRSRWTSVRVSYRCSE